MSFEYQKEVKILTPNFVDSKSTIVSSNGGTTAYLFDKDNESIFEVTRVPEGKRDTEESILSITFNVGTVETEFEMNCFMLFGCNIRDMSFDYWNGTAWKTLTTIVGNADDYLIRYFGAITTSRVRLRMLKTINPNELKKIAELIVARHRFNFLSYSVLKEKSREMVSTLELGDGSIHRSVMRFSTNRTNKYGAVVTFDYLTRQQYYNLRSLKNENSPFLWMPESTHIPEEIYLVQWVNPFTSNYWKKYKGNGYSVQLQLEEV